MTTKRLFLFASYDKDNCVDFMLVHYLNALSKLGDIVFIMDNPLTPDELEKITEIPNVLYVSAEHHGEYDFGSYKLAYQWAQKNHLLAKYDWVYLVNDSVLGPLFDLGPVLEKLESNGTDVIGMSQFYREDILPHIQSWFIGLRGHVATANYVEKFMNNIRKLPSKELIVQKYEIGLSQMLYKHGHVFSAVSGTALDLSQQFYKAIAVGIPFLKKRIMHMLQMNELTSVLPDTLILPQIKFWLFCHDIDCREKSYVKTGYSSRYRIELFNCIPILRILRKNSYGISKDKYILFGMFPIFSISKRP